MRNTLLFLILAMQTSIAIAERSAAETICHYENICPHQLKSTNTSDLLQGLYSVFMYGSISESKNDTLIEDLTRIIATYASSDEVAQDMIERLAVTQSTCIESFHQAEITDNWYSRYTCVISSLIEEAESKENEDKLIIALKAKAVQIGGLGKERHYNFLVENTIHTNLFYDEFISKTNFQPDEALVRVFNLEFQEIDIQLGVAPEGVKTRDDIIMANPAYYKEGYEADTGEELPVEAVSLISAYKIEPD
ncbi:MAG: hypothetical protein AAFY36_19005 [Bacteroidota bacterium]